MTQNSTPAKAEARTCARKAASAYLANYAAYTLAGRELNMHVTANRWGMHALHVGTKVRDGRGWDGLARAAAAYLRDTDY